MIWANGIVPQDPISGWLSVFLQTGALGMLAYIIAVLYPKQSKESRDEREVRDKIFLEGLHDMSDSIRGQTKELVARMDDRSREIDKVVEGLYRAINGKGEKKGG